MVFIFFIEFLDEVGAILKVSQETNRKMKNIVTLVHCKDGAGRTGVTILTQALLNIIEKNQVGRASVQVILNNLHHQKKSKFFHLIGLWFLIRLTIFAINSTSEFFYKNQVYSDVNERI